ncbi:MAG: FAD-binding protein, partial [Candidatus Hodarchaeales archaeon]
MVLETQVFKEFEEVVGVGNINDGDVITNVYAFNWCMEIFNYMDDKEPIPFSPVPKAVVLPSCTEEVQQIVKLCNKYGIVFKAQSTGFGPWNQPSVDNSIIIDLRRMNKIVK